ncbi:DUF1963 domain-containing protein [Mycobacterium sp. NPDC049093]
MIVPDYLAEHFADLVDTHLGSELGPAYLDSGQPALHFELGGAVPGPVIGSRIGGEPVLPRGMPWPSSVDDVAGDERHLVCMAVLELWLLAPYADVTGLPIDGTLTFFYADDAELPPWGEPYQAGGWKVVYTPPGAEVEPEPPVGVTVWAPRLLIPVRAMSYPVIEESYFDERRPFSALHQAWNAVRYDDELAPTGVQIGGIPEAVQWDPRFDATRHRGVEPGSDWCLLLQLTADARITEKLSVRPSRGFDDWLGGDFTVYFLTRDRDLRDGDFSQTWLIAQR